jgi:multidrug efflux pump subunit AcrB
MNLTKYSIEKNRVVISLLSVAIVMGLVMYQSLSRNSMPPYTVRVASIVTSFPGAGPERVEQLVTDKIEKVAQELPELKLVKSTSRTGLSVVQVELRMEVAPDKLQQVWDRLRRKLNTISDLPSEARSQLKDDGIGEVFGIAIGLTSDGFDFAEMKDYADDMRDELIKLDDAAKVEINGIQQERIFIEFDNVKLKSYGLTSVGLRNLINSTNILNSGGEILVEDERIILEPTGNFNNLDDIRSMLVPVGQRGQVLKLGDITTIVRGYIDPPSQIVKINGEKAVSLHISLKEGANIIRLGEDVDAMLSDLQEKLPIGINAFRISSLDYYIDTKINDFVSNLLQSVTIVLLVMFFFLGFRTGFVVASLIPFVTITTLLVMGMIDMGLNQITLAALIMALGMMVDNGIVVAESIMVKMEKGVGVKQASIESGSELFVPLLISTLTTSAAFLSFYLAESVMGDIMGPLFVVITIALLSSWLISLTIIPMLAVFFLRIQKRNKNGKEGIVTRTINFLKTKYKLLILWALARNKTVIVSIVILFFLSIFGFTKLAFVFFPDSDRSMITIDINLPEGTRLSSTDKVVTSIEDFMETELLVNENREEGILDWSTFIGEGPSSYDLGYNPDEPNSNYAHILVNTTSFEINGELIRRLDEYCYSSLANADVKISRLGSTGGGAPIEIKVSGDDPDKLSAIAGDVKAKLFSIEGTKNIKDDWGPKGKKLIIEIDQTRAQLAGVTNSDIAISLQTALDGLRTGDFREGDESIPIIMRSEENEQQTLESLQSLNIYAQNSGRSVPFMQVANVVPTWQYAKIKRLDLNRAITISSQITENANASAITAEVLPWLDEQMETWGDGYFYTVGGDAEKTADNMGAVFNYLPLSIFIIFLLLIIQFNSFRKMTMTVATIPLGVIGMVIGLFIFQTPFGFMAFLGIISLAGIVINNAIVLIDRIEVEENEMSRKPQDAIIGACLQRFRPILLATFTTVLGLIPLYLGGGEIWEPMAVTIMVGLLFGTVITLVFIPSVYSLLYKVSYKGYVFNEDLMN